jgi:hypothetical protein
MGDSISSYSTSVFKTIIRDIHNNVVNKSVASSDID